MKLFNIYRPVVTSVSVLALITGMSGCSEPETQEPVTPNLSDELPTELQPAFNAQGMPEFLRPPHTRVKDPFEESKISNGYRYSQGQFDDDTYFGIYSYVDDSWSYLSTSIWSTDSSSLSNGMDISSDGDTWLQSGSYFIEADGTAIGEYATSFMGPDGVGTQYLTDFESSASTATYRSTIDHTNTKASPDCLYLSDWASDRSSSHQSCVRDDESSWSCDYTYTYEPTNGDDGAVVSVEYRSTQLCDDTATASSPDYTYVDTMTWNYETGEYTDYAQMECYDEDGSRRTFTYVYYDGYGNWYDENLMEVAGPSCGWDQASNNL